ncbi:MAG: GFA family protein [Rhodospirillales bacterium]|nr:GFA family protein [Rhodospirillales bacterium]
MSDAITGGCQCGAVRYECTEEPVFAGHCQCTNCQKFSGTGHASNMLFSKAAFSTTGDTSTYEYQADSGNTLTRHFCPKCGSPVYGTTDANVDAVMIRAGGLDDPSIFEANFALYSESAQAWDTIDPSIKSFPGMPPKK